ncbi:MAG TPA: hypothetical protein VIY73_13945, partial [Polyangiaceae bacterium]
MRAATLVSLSFVLAGCHGAAWDKTEVPPPSMPSPDGATWTQYCTYHGATDLSEVNAWLEQLGRQGWRLAGVGGQTATMYCFEARLPEGRQPS